MFGAIMEMTTKDGLEVRMAPLTREIMPAYIADGGMQSMQVLRYLGRTTAPTLEDEQEWYDRLRQDETVVDWGIYVRSDSDADWQLIGGTSLGGIGAVTSFRRATSGIVLFDQDWWGRGVASTTHRARTWYAFRELGLCVVYSTVYHLNEQSSRALDSVGYVQTGFNRNEGMSRGCWLHKRHFELRNPDDWAWQAWWHTDDGPSPDDLAAREKTRAALDWAEGHVDFP